MPYDICYWDGVTRTQKTRLSTPEEDEQRAVDIAAHEARKDDVHDAAIEAEISEVERVAVRALLLDDKPAIEALKTKASALIAKLKKPRGVATR